MMQKLFLLQGRRLAVVIASLLVVSASGAGYLYYLNESSRLLPDRSIQSTYGATSCQIVSKKLNVKRRVVKTYRADFLVSYAADHVQYRRWVSGNGLDPSFYRDEWGQELILTRFQVGGVYPCYYNPADPKTAVLVLRHDWGSMWPMLLVSALIMLIVCYLALMVIMRFKARGERLKAGYVRRGRVVSGERVEPLVVGEFKTSKPVKRRKKPNAQKPNDQNE